MPERPNPSVQLPGYSAPWDIPGQAKKLAARAAEGRGEIGAEQAAANRLFRTREADEYTSPLPRRVERVDDVTAGLGLDRATEMRVQRMVEEQRADFTKKGQTQKVFLAANALTETLRRIRDVAPDARMEITKRARVFWKNTQPTDYAKEPTVRAPQGTQMRSDTTIKSESGVRYVVPLNKAAAPAKGKTKTPTKGTMKTGTKGPLERAREQQLRSGAGRAPKPMPAGMNATPPMGAGPAAAPPAAPQGAAPAKGGAGVTQPPAGFAPIPHSSKGGFRKREGDGWIYWYPGAGVTSTPHPDDRGQARAKRSAEASGPVAAKPKGAGAPPGAPAGAGSPPPAGPGAGPPPLPPKPQAGAQAPGKPPAPAAGAGGPPAPPGKPGAAPTPPQGAAPPTMAGAPAPGGAAPAGAAGAPQQGPHKASEQPQVTKDHTGEKRQFHPLVHAHTPAGKENDFQHHAGEFQRHKAEKKAAMRAGDVEKAKAHTYAMNFHADKHNKLLAAAQGRQYAPKGNFPGADQGEGDAQGGDDGTSVIASQYDRAGSVGKDGKPGSAADPRERFVPESGTVKQMREKIGKAVNIMADLSQAHDHLSSLKQKRLEAKRSGHPLARRMISQIDAEIAATKHDIVQLEDAHGHAMQEVLAHQSQLRSEKIRANPIFQAFMNAMQQLSGLSQKIGASLGQKAGQALEGAKGAIADFKNRGAKAEQDAARAKFDQGLATASAQDADPESGEVKPLGVSKDDITAQFGDPEAEAADKERSAAAMDTLKKLGAAQGDEPEPEEASPEDVEALPDEEGAGGEEGGSEAEAALKDIFGMQGQREKQAAANKQRAEESAGFDRELASARNKRDDIERKAASQAEVWAQRNAGRSQQSVMREQLTGDVDQHASTQAPTSGVRPKAPPQTRDQSEDRGTVATGARRKQRVAVEKSMRLVKSAAWAEVIRLAPKLDSTLRKSVVYVAPLAHAARAPMSFLDLYG